MTFRLAQKNFQSISEKSGNAGKYLVDFSSKKYYNGITV